MAGSFGKRLIGVAALASGLAGGAIIGLEFLSERVNRAPALAASQGNELVGRASVIDGDTLEMHGQRIRLHGIDAPEGNQTCRDEGGREYRCGQRAAFALADKIGQHLVTCKQRDVDRYNRIVAICHSGSENLNGWLVSQGWAVAYQRYSRDYVSMENAAQSANRGIWAGEFVPPEDWRQKRYVQSTSEHHARKDQSGNCVIKGNISARAGERIYHVPSGQDYSRTRISPSKGERWFCTEAEARAAGWRRSRR